MRDVADPRTKGHPCCQGWGVPIQQGWSPPHMASQGTQQTYSTLGFLQVVAFCLYALWCQETHPSSKLPDLSTALEQENFLMQRKSRGDLYNTFFKSPQHFWHITGLQLSGLHFKPVVQVSKACLGPRLPIFVQGASSVPDWSEKSWQAIKVALISYPPD